MVATAKQTDPDDLVDRVIEDRYEVLRKLGDSQLGWVYDARHVMLGRSVILEVLGPELARSESARACFLRQARQASRLRHRGIVEVEHQGNTPNGSVYMATEVLQGTTLEAVLRREKKLPWARVRGIALQLTAALKAAHRRSVVHMGLRPAVVHLWTDGDGRERVKVAGFGMGEVGVAVQGTGAPGSEEGAIARLFGDGRYMPPEQLAEGRGSVQADVYALGAVLYHALTGEPVARESVLQATPRQGSREVVPARRKDPAIPEAVEASLARALSMEAGNRHGGVHELERELVEVEAEAVGNGEVAEEAPGAPEEATAAGMELSSPESELVGPPLLVSSKRVAVVREEEATTMLPRSHIGPREEATTMLPQMPLWRAGAPAVEATERLAVEHMLAASRPATGASHAPMAMRLPAAATPARLPSLEARPAIPTMQSQPVLGQSRPTASAMQVMHPPGPIPTAATSPPPPRAFEPMHGRPLPDPAPPDRTWLVAIAAAVLVAVGGVVVGIVIANASEPDREERGNRSSKAGEQDQRRR